MIFGGPRRRLASVCSPTLKNESLMFSSSEPLSIQISFTSPDGPDIGQERATLQTHGPRLSILAVCSSELVLHHPPGQTLEPASTSPRSLATPQSLVVQLPAEETELDLGVVAQPSGTALIVTVKTKKERSKPDRPLRASFQ
jgi:hypothetical protein